MQTTELMFVQFSPVPERFHVVVPNNQIAGAALFKCRNSSL